MKRSAVIILLIIFAGCAYANVSNSDATKFTQANRLLLNGNTVSALALFNQLVNANIKSPELYCNIAIAYYKDKEYGKCLAWYQKALLLAPRDQQILYNRSVVEGKLKKSQTLLPPSPSISTITADNLLAISTGLLTLAALLFFGLTLILPRPEKTVRNPVAALFIIPVMAVILLCGLLVHEQNQKHIVIISTTAAARMGPAILAKKVAELNEGDYVKTKQYYSGWFEIQLANGRTCWIFDKDAETIEDDKMLRK